MLVPLFEEGGECRVVLTVRSNRLRSHQGEVAFPGGRLDAGESVVTAALREANEEVSLDASLVTVIGELTAMPTISSGTVMTPVVGTLARATGPHGQPGRGGADLRRGASELAADGVFHEEWWTRPGRLDVAGLPVGEFPVWFFEVAGETVWGATARTLMELICLVLGVAFPAVAAGPGRPQVTPPGIGKRTPLRSPGPAGGGSGASSQAVTWEALGRPIVGVATDRRCGELRPGSGGTARG